MKVCICGLGIMGSNHLRSCRKNGYEILDTFDPVQKNNYSNFLNSLKKADALIIASPTKYHTTNIIEALDVNPRLKILCEKPITFSSEDKNLKNIISYEKNILIGQVERFNPVIKKLKDILNVSNEKIIQIKTSRVNNTPSREIIDVRKDIGIHDLDISCYLCQKFPDNINIMSTGPNNFKNHENLFYKIEDIQVINEISWKYPYKNRQIEILTESGIYKAHYFNQTLNFIDWSNTEKSIEIKREEPLSEELRFFENMVRYEEPSSVTITENVKLLKLLGY